MVPEIMLSWNIDKKEAIRLAAERWNDMTPMQKQKFDEKNLQKAQKVVQDR